MKLLQPSDNVVKRVLARLKNEFEAEFHYLSLANQYDVMGFPNAAAFFAEEAASEATHARKLMSWLNGWNIKYQLPQVAVSVVVDDLGSGIDQSLDIESALWEAYNADAIAVMGEDTSAYTLFGEMVQVQTEAVAEYITLRDRHTRAAGNEFLFDAEAFEK